jgi:hypothetical protein
MKRFTIYDLRFTRFARLLCGLGLLLFTSACRADEAAPVSTSAVTSIAHVFHLNPMSLLAIIPLIPLLTRALKALMEGGGLVGVVRSVFWGSAHSGAKNSSGPKVSALLLFLLPALLLGTGCAEFKIGKGGLSARAVQPGPNKIVIISGRKYGISIGQNQATQQPEVVIGVQSFTYQSVPTGSNVFAPPVTAGFELDQNGFSAGIHEHMATGSAALSPVATNNAPLNFLH